MKPAFYSHKIDLCGVSITMFVEYKTYENGIIITVREGSNKPYFLQKKDKKLTSRETAEGFKRCDAAFGENHVRTLGITGEEGM